MIYLAFLCELSISFENNIDVNKRRGFFSASNNIAPPIYSKPKSLIYIQSNSRNNVCTLTWSWIRSRKLIGWGNGKINHKIHLKSGRISTSVWAKQPTFTYMVGCDCSLSAKAIHVSYTALPNETSTYTQTCIQRRPWVLHTRQSLTMFDSIAYV